jgi:hypothetical protein
VPLYKHLLFCWPTIAQRSVLLNSCHVVVVCLRLLWMYVFAIIEAYGSRELQSTTIPCSVFILVKFN